MPVKDQDLAPTMYTIRKVDTDDMPYCVDGYKVEFHVFLSPVLHVTHSLKQFDIIFLRWYKGKLTFPLLIQ